MRTVTPLKGGQFHRHSPRLKPDLDLDYLLSDNYIGRFVLFERAALAEIGEPNLDISGAEEFDLVLRFIECRRHCGNCSSAEGDLSPACSRSRAGICGCDGRPRNLPCSERLSAPATGSRPKPRRIVIRLAVRAPRHCGCDGPFQIPLRKCRLSSRPKIIRSSSDPASPHCWQPRSITAASSRFWLSITAPPIPSPPRC